MKKTNCLFIILLTAINLHAQQQSTTIAQVKKFYLYNDRIILNAVSTIKYDSTTKTFNLTGEALFDIRSPKHYTIKTKNFIITINDTCLFNVYQYPDSIPGRIRVYKGTINIEANNKNSLLQAGKAVELINEKLIPDQNIQFYNDTDWVNHRPVIGINVTTIRKTLPAIGRIFPYKFKVNPETYLEHTTVLHIPYLEVTIEPVMKILQHQAHNSFLYTIDHNKKTIELQPNKK